mmetsp:Transcript_3636/g.11389  ORF Transcript_3636/g.11389 Transcript_3636/m.11389 type:complete len:208 (+) Transcript_3636:250-873(+)
MAGRGTAHGQSGARFGVGVPKVGVVYAAAGVAVGRRLSDAGRADVAVLASGWGAAEQPVHHVVPRGRGHVARPQPDHAGAAAVAGDGRRVGQGGTVLPPPRLGGPRGLPGHHRHRGGLPRQGVSQPCLGQPGGLLRAHRRCGDGARHRVLQARRHQPRVVSQGDGRCGAGSRCGLPRAAVARRLRVLGNHRPEHHGRCARVSPPHLA